MGRPGLHFARLNAHLNGVATDHLAARALHEDAAVDITWVDIKGEREQEGDPRLRRRGTTHGRAGRSFGPAADRRGSNRFQRLRPAQRPEVDGQQGGAAPAPVERVALRARGRDQERRAVGHRRGQDREVGHLRA